MARTVGTLLEILVIHTTFLTESETRQCVKCCAVAATPGFVMGALRIGQESLMKTTSIQDTGLSSMLCGTDTRAFIYLLTDHDKALQLTINIISRLMSAGLTPSCHPLLTLIGLYES
jgi:SET and MYND domain-containing protein